MNMHLNIIPLTLAAVALPAFAQAESAASNADRRVLSAAAQRDAQGNANSALALSLPVGQHGWLQGGLGQTSSHDATTAERTQNRQASLGAGLVGARWQASLGAAQRRDGDRLRQQDLTASIDWRIGQGWSVGLDVTRREGRAEGIGTTAAGAPGRVTQRLTGQGAGVRVAVAANDRLTVYGAVQKSHFTSTTETAGTTAGRALLGGVLTPANQVTVVNREESALTQSRLLGATARVSDRVAASGEVAQDRLLAGGTLRSAQLRVDIGLGGSGWTLSPGVGVSRGSAGASVGSGSLRASYAW